MKIETTARTDTGLVRYDNEDGVRAWPEHRAWAVLDGMGGQRSGYIAVDMIFEILDELFLYASECSLEEIATQANRMFYHKVRGDNARRGSGAAGLLVRTTHDMIHWAHAGDCRLYRMRGEELTQLTQDHSLLADYLAAGHVMTQEEIEAFPHKNIITRAFGVVEELECEVGESQMMPGDLYLGCTNGFHRMVDDQRLAHVLTYSDLDGEELADRLILEANMAGGEDNISFVLAWVR